MPERHLNSRRPAVLAILALTMLATLFAASASASAATYSIGWHKALRKLSAADGGFTAVSCAAVNQCVAVDGNGDVIWSTSPTSSSSKAWGIARVDKNAGGLTGISCPLKSLCVAVDSVGDYVYSTDPTGGAKHWSAPARIDAVKGPGGGYAGLSGISCATASKGKTKVCVAVDNAANGDVVVTTNPTGGAKTWRRAAIASRQELTSVSCSSVTLCVAVGTERYYATSVHGVASDWHAAGAAPGNGALDAVGCALSTATCVGVGFDNSSTGVASASSKVPAGKWTTHSIESQPPESTEGLVDGVACPNRGFCVAVDGVDNAYTTNHPINGGWSGPVAVRPGSASVTTAVSCTPRICLVVDDRGVLTSGSVKS